ncbi:hypothetical protein PVNG_02432 [Plasmodium vivax North Korean]|uniref:G domain-containing protein n=1 Tax=Plasmodium vivax North Korean TaxID=1035514 RepID=A0A0J9TLU4_PLAVI|nr:hypothetical protein PVNG_02432 [Plasmodium vivax North Korean]
MIRKVIEAASRYHVISEKEAKKILHHDHFDSFSAVDRQSEEFIKFSPIYRDLVEKYRDLPKVLSHNDISLKNLIYHQSSSGEETLTLIDYEVLLVGATNVGKSQLFNRLIQDRHSIVFNKESLTRDLVMRKIILEKIGEPDGVRVVERRLCKLLFRYCTGVKILVVNKIDSKQGDDLWRIQADSLGLGEPILVSAEHDINIRELVARIENSIDKNLLTGPEEDVCVKIGIVGKVNVGKSSLANALLSFDKIIVSPIEGTTVDLVEYILSYEGKSYLLIDSPG